MLRIPENFVHTRSTPFWDKDTAPKALFTHHTVCPWCKARCAILASRIQTQQNRIWNR